MVQILNSLTPDYHVEVKFLEKKLSDTSNPLTIEDMQEELSFQYKRIQ